MAPEHSVKLASAATAGAVQPSAGVVEPAAGVAQPVESIFSSISCVVFAASRRQFPPDWRLPERQVACDTLYLCLAGQADFVVGGEAQRLEPGVILRIPPHAPYRAGAPHGIVPEPLDAYIVEFTARLHGLLDVSTVCGLPVLLRPGAIRWPKLVASAQTLVLHLAKRMPGYELALHTHCVRLLDLMWKETLAQRARQNLPAAARGGAPAWLVPVLRAIEARAGERVTLAELAEIAHLHPAYFSTAFKRVTGLAPLQYVTRYRLERARNLLLLTDRSVGEIAALTGFYDAAHLIRLFRRVEGVPPGRYRRSGIAKNHPILR